MAKSNLLENYITIPDFPYKHARHLEGIGLPENSIDKNVQGLVRALMSIGLETEASCEGHLLADRHTHPWLAFSGNILPLNYFLNEYNAAHKIKWETYGEGAYQLFPSTHNGLCEVCYPRTGAKGVSQSQLLELQHSAKEFADFIFENRHKIEGAKVRVSYELML